MLHPPYGLQRLTRQAVAGRKFTSPADVTRWMGALQAQDYLQAVWALGLRTEGGTLASVEAALQEGSVIRTWPMRGTIHFVPPEDARWMLKLGAAKMLAGHGRRMGQLDLSVEIMARCEAIFREVLAGRKRMTRAALLNELEQRGISTLKQRGYHILWHIAQQGVICIGPMEGKEQTFELLDAWAPDARNLSREEGLVELARRYFTSHGPATVQDFAWWAGLTVTEARQGLEGAKPGLIAERRERLEYWMSPEVSAAPAGNAANAYLLPGFDEFLLGYKDRGAVLPAEHAQKVVPGGNGVFFPMIVVGGQVVGVWKRALKKKAVEITLYPFESLNGVVDQVAVAAQAYADFVGLPLSLKRADPGM